MRLDEFLYTNNYFDSRTKANQAIKRGEVYVNGKLTDKPSFLILDNQNNIEIKREVSFVSLGGYKMHKALSDFSVNVHDLICLDVGASTGGFTDCLLQNGASKVYTVDLNNDLLHSKLKLDTKVVSIVKNAKFLTQNDFIDTLDLLTADLSFISETVVLPIFYNLLEVGKKAIILIKPQFEQDKKIKAKNGILKEMSHLINACRKVYDYSIDCGFCVKGLTVAPLVKKKNVEFLILLEKSDENSMPFDYLLNKCDKF